MHRWSRRTSLAGGGAPDYVKSHELAHAAITYRLGEESILDLPNKFVGPKKCGECHLTIS